IENLNFHYEIKGDHPHWRPLRAFDDGHKVFIQFPARLDQGEAPPLFVMGRKGKSQLVNYRVKGAYYIVDRLFKAAELRLGEKDQDVVRIVRDTKS
ncbi:MAG: TrbG/VirB9 family P-type conjugative transfer protein, partial [Robiginitomaculum sp.]|nr:TrbG/VirB9 family P-type conjugative transfer protein [Robiginitomaculum sp.]